MDSPAAARSSDPATFAAGSQALGEGDLIILEPETWVGKRFPLLKHIDIGDQLAAGNWTVMLYHHDCPECLDAIAKYEGMARSLAGQADEPGIALVEVPPYGNKSDTPASNNSAWLFYGRLSDAKEWFITTPTVVSLTGGEVTRHWENWPW